MADEWDQYAVQSPQSGEWEQYAVKKNANVNPTGKTWSPQDFLDQELVKESANNKPMGFGFNPQQYFQQAQPAFKLALEHPETLMGQVISPDKINQTTGSEYSDLYRRANLPGSNSTSMMGQMIPQIAGMALDIGTRPSSAIAPAVMGAGANAMANNPATRRFLQNQMPTLSKGLIEANPMAPVYKEINGIQRDITKPLPSSPTKLVKQGQKLVDAVHETMDTLGGQYGKILEPFYKTKIDISDLPHKDLKQLGLIPKGVNAKQVSLEYLWKGRWDLMKMVGNPWRKEALLNKTSLTEDKVTNLLMRAKASVLNSLPKETRDEILRLDPQFEDAISAGKGLLRTAYDPNTGKINTVRLTNLFKNNADEGTRELFNRFSYYDKRVSDVANSFKAYNRNAMMKKIAGVGVVGVGLEQFLRWKLRQGIGQSSAQGN